MAMIEWSDKYAVGEERIDYEHQRLFKLVNDLNDANKAGDSMHMLAEVYLGQLVKYCDYHFNTEEVYMAQANYPGFAEHKHAHDDLRKQVLEFQEKFKKGKANVGNELMSFLKNWLEGHILHVDTKLAAYLASSTTDKKPA